MRRLAVAVVSIALAAPAFSLAADAPAPVRHVVQTGPVSAAADEQIVATTVDFAPGSSLGFHTHPGEEAGVVVAGELNVEIQGQAPKAFKTGEGFIIPRGTVHRVWATGQTRVVSTYVVDKDKPLVTMKP